jgi:serine/threonine-protein kinase
MESEALVESATRTSVDRELPVLLADRFEVRGVLGEGAFGVVYLAFDRVLEREVALKFVRSAELADGDARARFLREAHALSAVSHPNVVTVYDLGEFEGNLFLCLERVRGATLKELLREGPLPVPEALAMARDLLSALEAIHAADLVHRDVKPGNVMLDATGRVKLMDFGLAKGTHRPLDLTSQEVAVGTPLYMAPEQWMNRSATPRTDIFSLGVLLYEMVTGRSPFTGKSVEEVQDSILYETPKPLAEAVEGVPAALSEAVERALRKAPEERFATAEEMRAALPSLGPGLERTALLRRRASRSPAVEPRPLTEEEAKAFASAPREVERPRRRLVLLLFAAAAVLIACAVGALELFGSDEIEVSIRAFREGPDGVVALKELDAVSKKDQIYFEFEASTDAYVYLVNRSPDGTLVACFPSERSKSDLANPFVGGRAHRFPPSVGSVTKYYRLDDAVGTESFYLFAFRRPNSELEAEFRRMRQVEDQKRGEQESQTVAKADSEGFDRFVGKVRGVQDVVPSVPASPRETPAGRTLDLPRLVGEDGVVREFRLEHR